MKSTQRKGGGRSVSLKLNANMSDNVTKLGTTCTENEGLEKHFDNGCKQPRATKKKFSSALTRFAQTRRENSKAALPK